MCDTRVRNTGAKIIKHPKRDSDDPERRAGWEENPEWLLADSRQRLRPAVLNVRWRRIHDDLIPGRGLEPLRIAPPDPKSGASANFATLAAVSIRVIL